VSLRVLLGIVFSVGVCSVAIVEAQEMEHRMGGLPGMPAHVLKPTESQAHHRKYHNESLERLGLAYTFGELGAQSAVSRTIRIDALDPGRFQPEEITARSGETVKLIVHNGGTREHELRIGDPIYQREHAQMLLTMPNWEHGSSNAVTVGPGQTKAIVWRFGEDPIVELACHRDGNYHAGMVTRVEVSK
jgi:uncharacterized cupredoxin-like copper-binding protein